jgi:hypothetical protein
VKPELYTLQDLLKDSYPGHFYSSQLIKAPKPDYTHNFFAVEKIIHTKTINKKKYFLVKYLYYPSKFNAYVLESDLKVGDV